MTDRSPIDELIARARAYRKGAFVERQPLYRKLVSEGQSPKIAMVACSDSRVDPSIIFDCDPGQIFMIRNVANMVAPYAPDGQRHGTAAALEFAVRHLEVEHVVVLGHAHCGGVRALLNGADRTDDPADFIGHWLSTGAEARDEVRERFAHLPEDEQARALELAAARRSIANLESYPWIAERRLDGRLRTHAWHFDIAEGALRALEGEGETLLSGG